LFQSPQPGVCPKKKNCNITAAIKRIAISGPDNQVRLSRALGVIAKLWPDSAGLSPGIDHSSAAEIAVFALGVSFKVRKCYQVGGIGKAIDSVQSTIDTQKMQRSADTVRPPQSQQPRQRRRNRNPTSCSLCRASKVGCDRKRPCCSSCLRRNKGVECHYTTDLPKQKSKVSTDIALAPDSVLTQTLQAYTPSQVPSSEDGGSLREVSHGTMPGSVDFSFQSRWDAILQRPVEHTLQGRRASSPIGLTAKGFPFFTSMSTPLEQSIAALPAQPVCEYLITHYFQHISPFFHVLHGPTFQKQYKAHLNNPSATEPAWLALLFLICSTTVNIFEEDDPTFRTLSSALCPEWKTTQVSQYYRQIAMDCLCQSEFLVRFNLGTLEALLLLVYTISHNEGVDRSWTLLGKAT
jgi:hypothetical protein